MVFTPRSGRPLAAYDTPGLRVRLPETLARRKYALLPCHSVIDAAMTSSFSLLRDGGSAGGGELRDHGPAPVTRIPPPGASAAEGQCRRGTGRSGLLHDGVRPFIPRRRS